MFAPNKEKKKNKKINRLRGAECGNWDSSWNKIDHTRKHTPGKEFQRDTARGKKATLLKKIKGTW